MKHVLVIDDSPVVRKVARRILEAMQLHAADAADGEAALASCDERMPDAIIVDWRMPGMDALEFTQALRGKPQGDRPKVLFCTSQNDVAHIARALRAGLDDYVMKPFDRRVFQSKFEELGFA